MTINKRMELDQQVVQSDRIPAVCEIKKMERECKNKKV